MTFPKPQLHLKFSDFTKNSSQFSPVGLYYFRWFHLLSFPSQHAENAVIAWDRRHLPSLLAQLCNPSMVSDIDELGFGVGGHEKR